MYGIVFALFESIWILFWGSAVPETRNSINYTQNYRLPNNIIPYHYKLDIQTYLTPGNFSFDGEVDIEIRCQHETDTIVLHSFGLSLDFDSINVRGVNDNVIHKLGTMKTYELNEFVVLKLTGSLKRDSKYKLFIRYNGKMDESEEGLFISEYKDKQNITRFTASTQFQPMHARNAFPCFDEPALKATFEITLVRWKNMTSLSNMPKARTESRGEEWEADVFQRSMKMSTELVAFFVGEFVGETRGKITFWTSKDKIDRVGPLLDLSSSLLKFYELSLGVEYVAPKLDVVILPRIGTRGMENWGLIVLHETVLSSRKGHTTRKKVVQILAHEIAHQWFGNLVTPEWWSDIWLSEGISTYMEQIASVLIFPEHSEVGKTVLLANSDIFKFDCLSGSSSTVWKNVTGKVTLPFSDTFNTITYDKGAIVTRMVHYILGEEIFWDSLSRYLKENAYGTVKEEDFWNYMTMNSEVNISEVMPSWTHLDGMPIVSVKRNYKESTATLSQISCKAYKNSEEESKLWHIPISFSSSRNSEWMPKIAYWLQSKNATIDINSSTSDWILVNGHSIGNYIVNYDRRNWKLLAHQLKSYHEMFSPEQRYKIISDANNLRALGYIDLTEDIMLDLSSYLPKERNLLVFSEPTMNFMRESLLLLKHTPRNKQWEEFVLYFFGPIYETMGWDVSYDKQGGDIIELRRSAIYWLCEQHYEPCVTRAQWKYQVWKSHGPQAAEVTFFTAPLMLCVAAGSEDSTISHYIYEEYLKSKAIPELLGLACSSDVSIIDAVLEKLVTTHPINVLPLARVLSQNNKHWSRMFEFIGDRLQDADKRNNTFNRLVRLLSDFDENAEISEKILEVCRRISPTLTGWKKEKIDKLIHRHQKIIPKLRLKIRNINNWLSRKPWLKLYDEEFT